MADAVQSINDAISAELSAGAIAGIPRSARSALSEEFGADDCAAQAISVQMLPGLAALLKAAATGAEHLLLGPDEWTALEAWHVPFIKGLKDRLTGNPEATAASTAPDRLVFVTLNLTRGELAILAAMAASDSDSVRHSLDFLSLASAPASVTEAGGVNNPAGGGDAA